MAFRRLPGTSGLCRHRGRHGRRLAVRAGVSVWLGLLLVVGGTQPAEAVRADVRAADGSGLTAPEPAGRSCGTSERTPVEEPVTPSPRTVRAGRAETPWAVGCASTASGLRTAVAATPEAAAPLPTPLSRTDLAAERARHTALRC
ncbi:hypothetical protein [Streptomyces mesophilus]|uniref:hypothetical protein n=1 Tax=Streptomyces mesophilus TaxID=1775132 RepID=UPI00333196B5